MSFILKSIFVFVPLILDITQDLFSGEKISVTPVLTNDIISFCLFSGLICYKLFIYTELLPLNGCLATVQKNKTGLPTTAEIVSTAYDNILKKHPEKFEKNYILNNFSEMNEVLFYETYDVYLKHENKAFEDMTQNILSEYDKETYSREDVKEILSVGIKKASTFEKSLKQSRASRAGKAYEIIVTDLLDRLGVKSEHITKEDKKSGLRPIDIVIPDRKTAIDDPDQAQFLSLKTSLKDRWKLVVEDQKQGQRTHLLTLLQNEKLTKEVAEKISSAGIFTYVPDHVKEEQFPSHNRIRKLSDLPSRIAKQ